MGSKIRIGYLAFYFNNFLLEKLQKQKQNLIFNLKKYAKQKTESNNRS